MTHGGASHAGLKRFCRPCGVAELMEGLLERARERSEAVERNEVADEVRQAVADSGLTSAEFAVVIGTSGSRLSTYMTGKVVPSSTLLVRIRRVADRYRSVA